MRRLLMQWSRLRDEAETAEVRFLLDAVSFVLPSL